MDWIFYCRGYSKAKKMKLVVIKFIDYTLIWWDYNVINRRNGEKIMASKEEMKELMRRRFVPNYDYRDLYMKL